MTQTKTTKYRKTQEYARKVENFLAIIRQWFYFDTHKMSDKRLQSTPCNLFQLASVTQQLHRLFRSIIVNCTTASDLMSYEQCLCLRICAAAIRTLWFNLQK